MKVVDKNTVKQAKDAKPRGTADEVMFFVVFAVRKGADDFSVEGLFSKYSDAEKTAKDLEGSGTLTSKPVIVEETMRGVIDRLLKERLRELANPILALAAERGVL